MTSRSIKNSELDINKNGLLLLLHGSQIENFTSIARYGLVSGNHFKKRSTKIEESVFYDKELYGCPYQQEISREGY